MQFSVIPRTCLFLCVRGLSSLQEIQSVCLKPSHKAVIIRAEAPKNSMKVLHPAIGRIWHKINFLCWFEFRVFHNLDHSKVKESSLPNYLSIFGWRQVTIWIHIFPKGICSKLNTNSLIQGLNSSSFPKTITFMLPTLMNWKVTLFVTVLFVLYEALLLDLKQISAYTKVSIINKCLFTFIKYSYIVIFSEESL